MQDDTLAKSSNIVNQPICSVCSTAIIMSDFCIKKKDFSHLHGSN